MKFGTILLIAFVFAGCGTSRKKWVAKNCNELGGYAQGHRDGQAGRNMNTNFLEKCPPDSIEITQKGYLDGFKAAGGKHRPQSEEHEYGKDMLKDFVHAINKKPSSKKQDDQKAEAPNKPDEVNK